MFYIKKEYLAPACSPLNSTIGDDNNIIFEGLSAYIEHLHLNTRISRIGSRSHPPFILQEYPF